MSKKIYETLNILWGAGLGIVVGFIMIAFGSYKFIYLLKVNRFIFIFSMVLLVVTTMRFVLYTTFTHFELNLLYENFSDKEEELPLVQPKAYIISFSIAFLFGCLIYFCDQLLLFILFLIPFESLDLMGQTEIKTYVREIVMKTSETPSNRNTLRAIKYFYVDRPYFKKFLFKTFCNVIALVLVIATIKKGSITNIYSNRNILLYIAYSIVILNLIINEVVLLVWRKERDRIRRHTV